MNNKLFVGQLPFAVDSVALENFFTPVGSVLSAKVITDKYSGQSKGFGFVEMNSEMDAQKAIQSLDGKELQGRSIKVSIAKPQEKRTFSR